MHDRHHHELHQLCYPSSAKGLVPYNESKLTVSFAHHIDNVTLYTRLYQRRDSNPSQPRWKSDLDPCRTIPPFLYQGSSGTNVLTFNGVDS